MRVIFQSELTPMTFVDPRTGIRHEGFGSLVVYASDANEELPQIPGVNKPVANPRSLAELRTEAGGQPLVALPTRSFSAWIRPVTIPDEILSRLPESTMIHWGWQFVPGAK